MATLSLCVSAQDYLTGWEGSPQAGDGYYWYKDLPDDTPDVILLDHGWGYVPGVNFPVALSALFGWWQPILLPHL